MPPKVAFALLAEAVVFALIIFSAAGNWVWPAGWSFLVLFFLPTALITLQIARDDPALLEERMRLFNQPGQPLWDRIFLGVLSAFFIVWLALMGFDARFGWSAVSPFLQATGAIGMLAGFWLVYLVMRENTFLAPVVKIQQARAQRVISSGPYAVVRHPMYAGAAILLIGCGLVLGSWWGVAGALVMIAAICWRTLGEERTLMRGLAGYGDYRRRVRWRIMPGLW